MDEALEAIFDDDFVCQTAQKAKKRAKTSMLTLESRLCLVATLKRSVRVSPMIDRHQAIATVLREPKKR